MRIKKKLIDIIRAAGRFWPASIVKIVIIVFLCSTSFIYGNEEALPLITSVKPSRPYVGTPFSIQGKNFGANGSLAISIGDMKLAADSRYITRWDDSVISFLMPDVPAETTVSLYKNDKFVSQTLKPRTRLEREFFNPTTYKYKYTVTITFTSHFKEGYIYVPQPIITDILTSKKSISLTPEPDYIQPNGILVYKANNRKVFKLEQVMEVSTLYKRVKLVDNKDEIPYFKDTDFYRHWTRSEPPFIIPEHKAIQKVLYEIVDKSDSTLEKLNKIYTWVTDKMEHQYPPDFRSPLKTIETGKGDCLTDAYLFTTLVRAAGIPIRLNSGYIFYHDWEIGGMHFWEEVFLQGTGWIPFDLSFGHSENFLAKHEYPAGPLFYNGALDGRRMAFCIGYARLYTPEDDGSFTFYKDLDSFQVPYIGVDDDKKKPRYSMKKYMQLLEVTKNFTEKEDWFVKNAGIYAKPQLDETDDAL